MLTLWAAALVALLPLASELGEVQSDDPSDFLSADAESTEVARIASQLEDGDRGSVVVVARRSEGLSELDLALVERHRREVSAPEDVGPSIPSDDGSTVLYTVTQPSVAGGVDPEDAAAEFVSTVRSIVSGEHDGLTVSVTGPTAIEVDVDEVFDGVNTTLLLVTLAVVAVLLILIYRSPLLWLLPLSAVVVAAVVASAAVYVVASAASLHVSTPSITVMMVLVFGAGTDYALLLVSRYREELPRHARGAAAMRSALRRAAPVVVASGLTTALGLSCLLAASMNHVRGLGLVGAVSILATMLTMLTLLPALLAVTGRRAFWPFVPRDAPDGGSVSRWWSHLARWVTRAPGRVVAGSILVLGSLAFAATTLPNELGQLDAFTRPAESVEGFETLAAAYPELGGRPALVAVPTGQETAAEQAIADTEGLGDPELEGSTDGWAVISAGIVAMPDSDDETDTVQALRERVAHTAGLDALVGGPAAQRVDTQAAVGDDLVATIPLVLLVVLVILAILLRALLAPVLVVCAVILSFGAALGIGALTFEHVFRFAGAEPDLPLLAFVFLVALGVDYAIFLVARIRDESATSDVRSATRTALSVTGPVVASAGIVLAATFAALMTLPYVPMVQLGFVIAVGVLLESLVVPAMLVSPLAARFGARMWWPRTPARLGDRVGPRAERKGLKEVP